ncbi:MAG: hypothetical protein A3K19_29610 [Lentisphaerae bacterium RIFOXYB12_FULL_65_16]|nr:MAG: hypothetical protein A3K18_29990 [Lentisphaerae bacterium RIFOXYA12_64_32]OGV87066.1 MAG: hypothetical protein A3K19_29610 [Lentisphaerae bacterium RIFOXYB12_FULL_65_16]
MTTTRATFGIARLRRAILLQPFSTQHSAFSILFAVCCVAFAGTASAVGPGYALDFDGTNDYVNCGNGASLQIAGNAITVEAWIRADTWKTNVWEGSVAVKDGGTWSGYMLRCGASGKADFNFGDGAAWRSATSAAVMTTGTWYHVAGVYDGSTVAVYIDGELCASAAATTNIASNANPLEIGASPSYVGTRQFDGRIDEVRVWNVARTPQQIREYMHVSLAGTESGLKGYWRLDNGSGTTASDATTYGNTGTLTNMDPPTDWVASTIPLAEGASATQTVSAPGTFSFAGTNLSMNVTAKTGTTTFVASRLGAAPNLRPAGTPLGNEYWVLDAYDGGSFTADVTLSGQTQVTANDQTTPARVRLHYRGGSSDGSWGQLAFASSADAAADTAVFSDVCETGQLVLTHDALQTGPGTGLDFDGTNDYVTCGTGPVVTGAGARTVEAWAYARAFNDGGIFQAGATGTNLYDFSFRTLSAVSGGGDNVWRIQLWGTGNDMDVTLANSKNQWHHYAMTYDGTTVKLYYDGDLAGTRTATLATASNAFWIGRWNTSYFDGQIDEVRAWNVARTQQQIRESMHLSLTGSESGLKGYWRLNNGSGTTATDATANAYNGTLTNMDGGTDWIAAPIPLASGASYTQTVSATGAVTFTGTDLSLNFTAKSGATTFVVSHLLASPNVLPTGRHLEDEYWVVHAYDGGTYTAAATFSGQDQLFREDLCTPSRVKLHSRASASTGAWSQLATASSANHIAGTATFNGLTSFSQLTLTHDEPTHVALDFDGVNDYVNVPHASSLSVTTALTIEAWVNLPTPARDQKIVGKTSIGPGYVLGVSSMGGVYPEVWNSSGTRYSFSTGSIPANCWTHVAMTWQTGGQMTAYINGVQSYAISAGSNPIGTNTQPLRIGIAPWNASSYPLAGKLDELRIWNVARTVDQLRDGMHKELGGSESGLVAYYRFDHTSGTSLTDLTANHNNGTLVNMTNDDWLAVMFPCAYDITGSTNLRAAWLGKPASLPSSLLSLTAPSVSGADFVVHGHNNGALTANTADKPAGLDWRLNRVWRLETDAALTGDFVFDSNGLTGLGNRAGMRLLADADGTFSNATAVAGSVVDGVLTVAAQALTDAGYYTLGGVGTPEVTTAAVSTLTAHTAQGGGAVVDEGGASVTARGCVWNTAGNPTVAVHDGMTTDGTGGGSFVSELTGLAVDTTYFVRAYATNTKGTAYGAPQTFSISFFSEASAGFVNVDFAGIAWGDYDGDGDLDAIVAGENADDTPTTRLYRNDGGVFTAVAGAGLPDRVCDLAGAAWGDYDNDGDLDLCMVGYTVSWDQNAPAAIYRNNGDGTFTDIGAPLVSVFFCNAKWADYDNDGDLDLLIAGATMSVAVTRLYRNDGGDTFVDSGIALANVGDSGMAWGDYDADGDLDILLAGYDSLNEQSITKVYRNEGDGVFTDIGAGLTGVCVADVAWGDYDNDGDLDILLAGYDDATDVTKVYRNDAGAFTDIAAALVGVDDAGVAWGDLDNDGDLDIAIAGYTESGNVAKVYRNHAGAFTEIPSADLTGVDYASVALGDYDGDGDLDLLITGQTGDGDPLTQLYRNEGAEVVNTPPGAPADLSVQALTGESVTLAWDAAADAQTPAAGLTYNLRVGTSPGAANVFGGMADLATGWRRVAALGNTNQRRNWTVAGLVDSTTYYWSVQAVDTALAGGAWAVEGSFTTPDLAEVTTVAVTSVTATSATCGGNVTAQGLSPVTARGCVWAMHQDPTLADFSTVNGAGLGAFTSNLIGGFVEGQTCYVRAYATNTQGTAYGENRAFVVPMAPPDLALEFDGDHAYVQIEDSDAFDLTTAYTIEAWFKADTLGGLRGLVSKYHSWDANGYVLRLNGTELEFDGVTTFGLGLQAGYWYHVAAVSTPNGRLIYVNGSQLVNGGGSYTVQANADPVRIGSDYNGRYFAGTIDEVRIWSVARTQTQIRDAMHRALAGTETGLVAYYRGDQLDGGPVLADRTGHGHDGTLYWGVTWVASTAPCTGTTGDRVQLRGVWASRTDSTETPSGCVAMVDPDIADTDYAVIGHDGGAETQNTTDVPANLHWRLNRVWRMDVAGAPTGDIVVDTSGLADLGDTAKLCLLVDGDGTFADATVIEGDFDYPFFTAADVPLLDGLYCTLGKFGWPSVTTAEVDDVTPLSATCGGEVTEAGASAVTARGCVWNTTGSPTVAAHDGITSDGTGTGVFSSGLTGLTLDQRYYVRSYATNAQGTAYGSERSFRAIMAPPGNCLDFDGTNDYVTLGNDNRLKPTDAMTVEVWAYMSTWATSTVERVFVSCTETGGHRLYVMANDARVEGMVRLNGAYRYVHCPLSALTPGWHHFALTCSGQVTSLYVDGILRDATDAGTDYPIQYNASNSLQVGAEAGGGATPSGSSYMLGRLDDVRIWNVVRSDAQIRWGMNRTLAGDETGLVGYWRFDHGTAGGDNAGITTVTDSGPNGLTGTLYNFALTGATSNWVESYAMARPAAYAAVPDGDGAFVLRWDAPEAGTAPATYYLDIATDPEFASLLSGYSNLQVGDVTSYRVTGLDGNTTYYWRVRAEPADGQAGQSQSSESMAVAVGSEGARFAPHFDGVDDYVTLPPCSALKNSGANYLHNEFLIEMWFRPEATDGYLLKKDGSFALRVADDGGTARLQFWGIPLADWYPTVLSNAPAVSLNAWHHVAVRYDGSTVTLYLDGVSAYTMAGTGDMTANSNLIYIGARDATSSFFTGSLAELRIWTKPCTETKVLRDWNREVWYHNHTDADGFCHYLPLAEGAGLAPCDYRSTDIFATIHNGAQWRKSNLSVLPAGPHDWMLELDGSSDYLTIEDSDFDLSRLLINYPPWGLYTSYTIEMWARRDSTGTVDMLYSEGNEDAPPDDAPELASGMAIAFDSQNRFLFKFYHHDGNHDILATTATYTDTAWHHWAVTYNHQDNARCIYRDGVLVASDQARAPHLGGSAFELGRKTWDATGYFDGALDELRIWTEVRTAAQISTNRFRTVTANDGSLVRCLRFNEWVGYDGRCDWVDVIGGAQDSVSSSGTILGDWGQFAPTAAPFALGPASPREQAIEFAPGENYGERDPYARLTSSIDLANQSLTIEFWAQRYLLNSTTDWDGYVFCQQTASEVRLRIGFRKASQGNAFFVDYRYDDAAPNWEEFTVDLAPAYTDADWHHWAVTFTDGSETGGNAELRVFRDGVQVHEQTLTFEHYQAFGEMLVGNDFNGGEWRGELSEMRVDDVRIWSRARDRAAIAADMNRELAGSEPFLEGYYKFNEGGGTTLLDASVYRRHGRMFLMSDASRIDHTFPGGFSYLPDTEQCLYDPPSVSVTGSEAFDYAGDFTWEAWIRPVESSGTWQNIIAINDRVSGWCAGCYTWIVQDGVLKLIRNGQSTIPAAGSDTAVELYAWQHVALRVEANTNGANDTCTFFVNGRPVYSDSTADLGAVLPAFPFLRIGSTFQGWMDELSIWSVARTDEEILQSYRRRLNGTESGLEVYYDFNGAGDAVIVDRTGNGHLGYSGGGLAGTLDATTAPDLFPAPPDERAASFSGTDGYADVPADPVFDSAPFSVEFWVKQDELGARQAMLDKGYDDETDWCFASQDGTPVTPDRDDHALWASDSGDDIRFGLPAIFTGTGNTISDFTIEFWLKPTHLNYEETVFEITRDTTGEGNFVRLMAFDYFDRLYLIVGDNPGGGDWDTRDLVGSNQTDACFMTEPANTWYHIACVFDADATGQRLRLYVNGIEQNDYSGSYGPTGTGACFLDRNEGGKTTSGTLDELRIWDVPRSQAEIVGDMHRTLAGNEPSLLHYYRLDDAVGSDTAVDSTGVNDATVNNDARFVTATTPFGAGVAETHPKAATVTFPDADLAVTFADPAAAMLTAVRIADHPGAFPVNAHPFDQQYWVLHRDGDDDYWSWAVYGSPYVADYTFTLAEDLTENDAVTPGDIGLYRRNHTSDDPWQLVATATTVDAAADTVTFQDVSLTVGLAANAPVSQSSQFVVARKAGQGVIFSVGEGTGQGWRELSYVWGDTGWHHVCGTYDGSEMMLYVDGTFQASTPAAMAATANAIRIGAYRGDYGFFDGLLDEIRYWSVVLSPDDVNFLYNKELHGDEAGLEAYWKFNEGSGITAYDSTGHGHDLTLYNSVGRVVHDNRYVVRPTGDYAVEINADTFVYVGEGLAPTDTMTIEAWVYKTAAADNPAVYGFGNSMLTLYAGHDGSEHLAYFDDSNGWIESDATVTVGEWHHLAWVLNKPAGQNGYVVFYLDGEQQQQVALTQDLPDVVVDGFIGRSGLDADPFLGYITEVRIWGVVRTAIEIKDHLYTRLAGNEAGLLAYWPCTDGSGQLVTDYSSNGHDGVFYYAFDLHWIKPEGLVFEKPLPTEQSLSFDGADTSVSLPFSPRDAAFTVGAWIKWDKTGADDAVDDVVAGWGGPGGHFAELRVSTEGKLMYCEFDGQWGPLVAAPTLQDNQWVHVGVAKTGTTVTLFLNGKASINGTIARTPQLDALAIGSAATDTSLRPFKGLIDEVTFWDVALASIPTEELWGDEEHLVRYYKFDEGGGARAVDSSGSGFYDGTLSTGLDQAHRVSQTGLPMVRLQDRQNALFFDGIDDYLELPHQARPDPMTIAVWVKPQTVSRMHSIVVWADTENGSGHLAALRLNAGHLEYEEVSQSGTVTGTAVIPANVWTHVAVTKTGNNVTLYVNGVPDGSGTIAGTPVTDRLVIGMQPTEPTDRHFYHGLMDEFQLWHRVLGATEVAQTYNHGRRGNETGLDTYFTFDQPTGLTVEDVAGADGDASMKNVDYPNLDRHEVDDLALEFPPPGEYVLCLDGVDDYLAVDGIEMTAYTVALWFKPDAAAPAADICLFKGPACTVALQPDGAIVHTFTTADGELTQTLDAVATFGAWNRVVAANDGLTARLYCGPTDVADFATDVARRSDFAGGRLEPSAGTITIGDDPDSDADALFKGHIEELAVWEWALPEKDIARLWEYELEGDEYGLTAFYNFDDGDPDAATDAAAPAQDAVLHNMVLTNREDREPGFVLDTGGVPPDGTGDIADSAPVALEFDGFDDYAVLPRAALVMDGASFTLELWLKPEPWTGRVPVITNADSNSEDSAWGIFLSDDEQHWVFDLLGEISVQGGAVDDRAWHHVAVVYDSAEEQVTLFQDGTEVAADYPADITGADNANNLFVGSDADQVNLYIGAMDEVRCWSVARTAAEIEADFNRYVRALAVSLTGYWRIHDTETSEVRDLGSGGHALTLHNMLDVNLVVGADFYPPPAGELALEFDGTDDYVVLQNPDQRLGLQTFTIACWFKRTGLGTTTTTGPDGIVAVPLVAKGREEHIGAGNATLVNYLLGIGETGVLAATFQVLDGNDVSVNVLGTRVLQDDTWYHAAVTYEYSGSAGELKLFLNGALERTQATSGQVPAHVSIQTPSIGSALDSTGLPDGYFAGVVDEVTVWNRALSADELAVGMTELRRGGETGLVGLWHGDDGWADLLIDSGRYGADGTLENFDTDLCWVAGRHFDPPSGGDHAIAFSAEGQCVEIDADHEDDFDFGGSFTVEFWLRVEAWDTPWQAMVSKGDSGWQVRRYADTQQIAFSTPGIQRDTDDDDDMDDLPELVSDSDIEPGEWTHVAVVYDADMHRKRIYIDGELDASELDVAGFVQASDYPVWVGANPEVTGRALNGAIDELRIWNVARSDVRIDANYNKIVRDNDSGLFANWRFNEGCGGTAFDSAGSTPRDGALVNLETCDRVDGVVLEEWSDIQYAICLDGADEDVALDALAADLTGGFSAEAWVRPDALQDDDENDLTMQVFHLATADNQTSVSLLTVGNDLRFEVIEGGAVTGSLVAEDVFTPTVWAHVAVTVDADGVVRLYIDGLEQAVSADGENVTLPANATWDGSTLGSDAGADAFFNGAIDEVRLWNYVRTPSEVQVFYDRQLFDNTPGLWGYWRLNEGLGDTIFDESDSDVVGTLNNTEEEDWVDGKYIAPDSTNSADFDLSRVPASAGLWTGKVKLNKVSEVAKVALTPTPTRDEMIIDILLHTDSTGQVRLLKDVTMMRTATDNEDNAQIVLVTDDSKLGDFVGLVNRNGVLIGLRKSSVFYDFDGNEWPMEGGLGFGHVSYGFITVPADHPTNPYRHKYHPDSKTGFRVDRSLFLLFDAEPTAGAKPGQGVDRLSGVYQETISGLHKKPIRLEGTFELQRISPVATLNNE